MPELQTPPTDLPVIDLKTGKLTQRWQQYFDQFQRLGGAATPAGSAGKVLAVNADETGMEATDALTVASLVASGAISAGSLSAATLLLTGAPPAAPAANVLYKHPTAGTKGFAVPMNPASALQSLAAALTAAQGGIAAGALEGWHEIGAASEPAFQNSWVNFGGAQETAAFRKDATGMVFLKGVVKNGTIGSVPVFTLPAGYRPGAGATQKYFAQYSNGVTGFLVVVSNGEVWAQVGSNVSFSLSCSFVAEG